MEAIYIYAVIISVIIVIFVIIEAYTCMFMCFCLYLCDGEDLLIYKTGRKDEHLINRNQHLAFHRLLMLLLCFEDCKGGGADIRVFILSTDIEC